MPCLGVVGGGWRGVLSGDGWFLLRALGVGRHGMVCRVLGRDASRGSLSLPCALLSASTLGLIAVVTPSRVRPPVSLRCQTRHLAGVPFEPRIRTPPPSPTPLKAAKGGKEAKHN